ncbi:MAG: 2-hydroxyglutaryl-CoA dehydratase [Nitrospirae bacterium]|nr:2-hydroxyglutaryl-CoA dehydratase [Nitrospirota bacterium]
MFIGIDLGSRSVKIVSISSIPSAEEMEITTMKTFDTAVFYRGYIKREGERIMVDYKKIGFSDMDPLRIVATGYGRNAAGINGTDVIPEIKAHTRGAVYQTGFRDFTLLDIGGQDVKVILVRDGRIEDFTMNDKCAASCGRYLENMATVLGVDIEELGRHHTDPVELDSTCAVFGESELIGKMTGGALIERLCAGVNLTILKRIMPMLNKHRSEKVVLAGGGGRIYALQIMLEERLCAKVVTLKYPQYNGAIGCGLYAVS